MFGIVLCVYEPEVSEYCFLDWIRIRIIVESEFWPNKNTNNIRFLRMSEYEYEWYSCTYIWPNTNTNDIRVQNCARIRIQIMCYSNNIQVLNSINVLSLQWIFLHTVAKSTIHTSYLSFFFYTCKLFGE